MMVGDMIRRLRLRNGWKQSELAEKLGISRQALSNYELNNRDVDNNLLVKIAELFNVSVDYILQVKLKDLEVKDLEETFQYEMDMSTEDFIKKHKLLIDGKVLKEKELKAIIAFIRFHRDK